MVQISGEAHRITNPKIKWPVNQWISNQQTFNWIQVQKRGQPSIQCRVHTGAKTAEHAQLGMGDFLPAANYEVQGDMGLVQV